MMYLQDNNAVLFCLHRLDGVDPPLPALQNIPERKVDIAVVDELSLSDAEADIEFDNWWVWVSFPSFPLDDVLQIMISFPRTNDWCWL